MAMWSRLPQDICHAVPGHCPDRWVRMAKRGGMTEPTDRITAAARLAVGRSGVWAGRPAARAFAKVVRTRKGRLYTAILPTGMLRFAGEPGHPHQQSDVEDLRNQKCSKPHGYGSRERPPEGQGGNCNSSSCCKHPDQKGRQLHRRLSCFFVNQKLTIGRILIHRSCDNANERIVQFQCVPRNCGANEPKAADKFDRFGNFTASSMDRAAPRASEEWPSKHLHGGVAR